MTRLNFIPGILLCIVLILMSASISFGHDVSSSNARFVEAVSGPAPVPFLYLGAKHMVTGIDHVFFLIGVVFFLSRIRDIVFYVSLFTIGHSLTLLGGVLTETSLNAHLVDAVIGLSVVYKAMENIGGFQRFGQLDMRWAVFVFGLVHGLGLSGKLQDLVLSPDGLITNLISFNIGVEVGQVIVLALVVSLLNFCRTASSFGIQAYRANLLLMIGGFTLMGQHLFGLVSGVGS